MSTALHSSGSSGYQKFEESGLKRAILASIGFHVGLFLFLIFKSIVAPSTPKEYIPSMRVDLVALPGHKINETPVLTPPALEHAAPVAKEKPQPKVPEVKVHNVPDKADISLNKKKSNEKMKNALAKIKALEKINQAEPIKGNQVSKGSALSGEAKNSLETTYYDVILEKVRGNWELPKWLQEQNVSAKIIIQIDRTGRVTSLQFVKPSGNDQFDQEVRRAIQISAPFPAPPTSILPDVASQGITLGFPL